MIHQLKHTTFRAVQANLNKRCKAVNVPSISSLPPAAGATSRTFHTSHQEIEFSKDEYVARQFGYRVVLAQSVCNVNNNLHEYEELDYTAGTNLDILASPEIQKIISSNAPSSCSADSLVFPPEAHVDNGYSSEDEGPNTMTDY
jgi:hypothetical protein